MSFHIVNIDAANCSLSCRDGQLTCKTAEGERKLPLEDVASIIITSWSAQIHSNLFLEAAKHGVALILCEAFKPVSLVLPANRSTDTLLTRAVLHLEPRVREALWRRTIDAKCENQVSLAEHLRPGDERLAPLRESARSRKPHKEAVCAKTFWQVFGAAVGGRANPASDQPLPRSPAGKGRGEEERPAGNHAFVRDRAGGGLNDLLNYGYAVLLSTVLQKLFGVGLDPTWGISHAPRERATPLAYDLMEPFRPCVDWRVFQWVSQHPKREEWVVSKEFRAWVTKFPLERVEYLQFTLEVQGVIEGVVRSFRRAVLDNSARFYRPWTPRQGKWSAG